VREIGLRAVLWRRSPIQGAVFVGVCVDVIELILCRLLTVLE
jgi:hypothetical protein